MTDKIEPKAAERAEEFLALAGQFRLGNLVTESPHPRTHQLSQTAEESIPDALGLLFDVDADVIAAYRRWIETGAPERISGTVRDALLAGGKVFFTGCGATGRLSILLETIWRDFWKRMGESASPTHPLSHSPILSVVAGGDYALIKSVEGFEDFAQFGAKQIEDAGVSKGDIVFAITEGGETSFVIGTAWQGLKKGAKVYFIYNNPDDILRENIVRSREIIDEPRIEKINLTTGPMAVMGSTRMQATTIQLCAMLTVLEMVAMETAGVPEKFLAGLEQIHASLSSEDVREQLAGLVQVEESAYRSEHKSTYFADALGIDVLTDTTERSPTFCTPAFRKWDDTEASESWTYLVLPYPDSKQAWEGMLKRFPHGLAWTEEEIRKLVGPEKAVRQAEIMKQIDLDEILRFRIGLSGLEHRPIRTGDAVISVITEAEKEFFTLPNGFYRTQMEKADASGASMALIFLGGTDAVEEIKGFLNTWKVKCRSVLLPVPETGLLLDGITRVGVKMLLNALSTCAMVRLGRVMGNCMAAVVPSNLKLIDRSIRYVQTLTGLSYKDACHELFKSIEYVRPSMQAGREYPPVVTLTVMRVRDA